MKESTKLAMKSGTKEFFKFLGSALFSTFVWLPFKILCITFKIALWYLKEITVKNDRSIWEIVTGR